MSAAFIPSTTQEGPAVADEHAKPAIDPRVGDTIAGQSKKAMKRAQAKAQKETEKARRTAENKAKEATAKATAINTEDLAQGNYGLLSRRTKVDAERTKLKDVTDKHLGNIIKVRGWIQNARMQSLKMVFIELREERDWAIQGIVASTPDGKSVSRQMVKWINGLTLESFLLIEGKIMSPLEPVKSVRVSSYELHITKCYCIAPAPESLAMSLAIANKAVTNFDEDDGVSVEGPRKAVEALSVSAMPSASMATHLNNPVMHKRAPVQQAIADVRMAARKLFAEYLDSQDFNQFEPPCLLGSASEGGSNVFGMPYFDKQAYLAQSPQYYKQFEIAGGRKRVYCIGPVFRAENSNTPRHMTEVR